VAREGTWARAFQLAFIPGMLARSSSVMQAGEQVST
jgi:hypothetical protein